MQIEEMQFKWKFYDTNETFYNTNKKLYNTHEEEYNINKYTIQMEKIKYCNIWHSMKLTRAQRGTDRSPGYNEHFCYKLD